MFGLEQMVIDLIVKYFSSSDFVDEVYIYGSRAMGTQSKGSDIDFVIVTNVDKDLSGRVKMDLEELPTPYLFDVCDLRYLSNDNLLSHIKRVGKVFYKR